MSVHVLRSSTKKKKSLHITMILNTISDILVFNEKY